MKLSAESACSIIDDLTHSVSFLNASADEQVELLFKLANSVDIEIDGVQSDATTILYSGLVNSGPNSSEMISSNVLIENYVNSGENIRVINSTNAAIFLNSSEFLGALAKTHGLTYENWIDDEILADPAKQSAKIELGNKLFHATDGPWALCSARFVDATTGDVRVIAPYAKNDRTFALVEIPHLMDNPNITSVEGIPRAELSGRSAAEVFEHVTNESWKNTVGTGLTSGNLDNWLNLSGDTYKNPAFIENLSRQMGGMSADKLASLKKTADFLAESSIKIGKHIPIIGNVLLASALALTVAEASAAIQRGNIDEANSIWIEFALKEFGGEVIGILASVAAGTVATMAGAPIAITTAVVMGAGILGGFATEATVEQYADLIRDNDKNGIMDIMDRLSNLFYGTSSQIPDRVPEGFDPNNKYNINTRTTAGELAEMAVNDMAYRYAIVHLNPFVITNYDYSRYSAADKYSYDSYSEAYWQDRAQMTWWHTQFQLDGQDTGRSFTTSDIDGNYDFVDMNTPVNGSDYFQLSIDGNGITLDDHKIIFGSAKGDKIIGAGASDRLYGDDGNDTLSGGADTDYIEGGDGDDILYGGSEDQRTDDAVDYLFGGDGNNRFIVDEHDVITLDDRNGIYGTVFLDNVQLKEAVHYAGDPEGLYKDVDGNIYRFDGNTLVINDGLRIVDYKQWAQTATAEDGSDIYSALGITVREEGDEDLNPNKDSAEATNSPIVLDLNGNGIETTFIDNVHFDHAGDALKELTGWVAPTDGLLVRDLNGDGIINSGRELFGNNTRLDNGKFAEDGYQALADLDDNGDGVIDSRDSAFSSLQVWQDADSDGITDAGEMQNLVDAGIVAINTGYTLTPEKYDEGNSYNQIGTFTRNDGTTAMTADVWFSVDERDRISSNDIPLTPEIMLLPDARGFGNVADLRQAMAHDAVLTEMVSAYVAERDSTKRSALLDQLIYRWAGVDDVVPVEQYSTNAANVAVLEQLTASEYQNKYNGDNVQEKAAAVLQNEYIRFKRFTAAQILCQTQYYEEMKDIVLTSYNSGVTGVVLDADRLTDYLFTLQKQKEYKKLIEVSVTLSFLNVYSPKNALLLEGVYQQLVSLDSVLAYYLPLAVNDDSQGVQFNYFSNLRYGYDANETLMGGMDDDIIMGNRGDDTSYGYGGHDTFIYRKGDGNDIIINDSYDSESDVLRFGQGIKPDDLVLTVENGSLIIRFRDEAGSVILKDYFNYFDVAPISLVFYDGTEWSTDTILSLSQHGSSAQDTLFAGSEGSTLEGLGGKDRLFGGTGDDVLAGGTGNDILVGGDGSDTYLFNRGDGVDVLSNNDQSAVKTIDTLSFGEGISADDLVITRVRNALVLAIRNTLDKVIIPQYFNPYQKPLDTIRFSDGNTLSSDDIIASLMTGTSLSQVISVEYGEQGNVHAGGGDDAIYGANGDDILAGDTGNDLIEGGGGSDTYLFNLGDGHDVIVDSNDGVSRNTIVFGDGIRAQDITISLHGSDLILSFNQGNDSVTLADRFDAATASINQIQFSDGTVWDHAFINALKPEINDSGQTLRLQDNDREIFAGAGNDIITGTTGNDVFVGGAGNDRMTGYGGHDIWRYDLGDGHDVIQGAGIIKLGQGITADTLSVMVNESGALILSVAGGAGSITVEDYFLYGNDAGLQIEFADGRVWASDDIYAQHLRATPEDQIQLLFTDDVVIAGGKGNDRIIVEGDHNTCLFGRGDGQDTVSVQADTFAVQFTESITCNDIELSVVGLSLVLSVRGTDDSLTLKDYFHPQYVNNITVRFQQGVEWDRNTVLNLLPDYVPPQVITGYGDEDVITGGAGNDYINGSRADDIVIGGKGDDVISGKDGSDTYIFNSGDGNDTIIDTTVGYSGRDILRFGEGISADDITLIAQDGDLILCLNNGTDSVRIADYFSHGTYISDGAERVVTINDIIFANGERWSYDDVRNKMLSPDDTNQEMYARGTGGEIVAGGGDDRVYGNTGEDILIGGKGNDHLYGRDGADTYLFRRGDGQDVIEDKSSFYERGFTVDRIVFAEGITPKDIIITASGNDVILSIRGTQDSITMIDYMRGYPIDMIEFADESTWLPQDIFSYVRDGIPMPDILPQPVGAEISMDLLRQSIVQFMCSDSDGDSMGVSVNTQLATARNTATSWQSSNGM